MPTMLQRRKPAPEDEEDTDFLLEGRHGSLNRHDMDDDGASGRRVWCCASATTIAHPLGRPRPRPAGARAAQTTILSFSLR